MRSLLCDSARLPGGWERDVLLHLDDHGNLLGAAPGVPEAGAERVRGAVVPGLPNLHSHAFQRAMAGRAESASDGDNFWTWRNLMYRVAQGVEPGDLMHIAAQLAVEWLRHGYTSVGEFHYLHHAPDGTPYDDPAEMAVAVIQGARAAGIGVTLLPTAYARAGFDGADLAPEQRRFRLGTDEARAMADTLRARYRDDPDVWTGVAAHSLRAVDPAALRGLVDGLYPDCPVHIHAAEQLREVAECTAHLGAPPVGWLLDQAGLDRRWCVVHATHLDPDEVQRLAASGAVVALCPTTEADLGDGIFPAEGYLGHGGRWGIGSDSQVCVDPAGELRLLEYGQRLVTRRRGILARPGRSNAAELLEAAWDAGQSALGRPVGRIASGYRADLLVLDPDAPTLLGLEGDGLLDAWIFGPGPTPVRDVMVGGRWVIRDGHHAAGAAILANYRNALKRVHAR